MGAGIPVVDPFSGTLRSLALTTTGCCTPATMPIVKICSAQIFSISCQIRVLLGLGAAEPGLVELLQPLAAGKSGASPAVPLVSMYWPHFGHSQLLLAGRGELPRRHVGGRPGRSRSPCRSTSRSRRRNTRRRNRVSCVGRENSLMPMLPPGIADQLEHVGLLASIRPNSRPRSRSAGRRAAGADRRCRAVRPISSSSRLASRDVVAAPRPRGIPGGRAGFAAAPCSGPRSPGRNRSPG